MRRETTHFSPTDELIESVNGIKTWGYGGGVAAPFLTHYAMVAVGSVFESIEPEHSVDHYIVWYQEDGGNAVYQMDNGDLLIKAKLLVQKPDFLKQKYAEWKKIRDSFYVFLRQSHKLDHAWYQKFEKVYINQYARSFYIEPLLPSDKLLDGIIEKHGADLVNTAIQPTELTFSARLRKQLLVAALEEDINGQAEAIQNSYHWVYNNYRDTDTYSLNEIKKEIRELRAFDNKDALKRELDELRNYSKLRRAHQNELGSSVSNEERQIIEVFSLVAMWLDGRKEANLRANSVINSYLKKISDEYAINLLDLQHLVSEELETIIDGRKRIDDFPVQERRHKSVEIFATGLGEFFLSGNDLKPFMGIHPDSNSGARRNRKFTGRVAMKGVARGRVRIVLDPAQARDFKSGDILVAYMTRPDFVPLMKKAAAIVTNEGGITSHAAVVSRELGVPCIIGTKIATQVLKDGDEVEVDADKGVVKVLKRA